MNMNITKKSASLVRKTCAATLAAITIFNCISPVCAIQTTDEPNDYLSSGSAIASLEAVGAGGAYFQDGIYFIACYGDIHMALNNQFRRVSGGAVLDPLNYEDNELWILINTGDHYFTLSPLYAPDYYLAGQLNDTQLRLAKGASDFNNQWKAIPDGDHYVLVNRKSGLAIDTAHGKSTTGNPVLNYYKNGYREAQSWTMGRVSECTDRLDPGAITTISNGLYAFLLKTDQSKCLNVQFNVKAGNGTARMCVDTYNGQENEEFYVIHRGNNYYTISPKSSPNVCLNVWAANPIAGSQLTLATYQEGDECSLWIPYKNSDGSISWKNKKTNLFMNDYYNRTNDGNPIVSYYFDDTNAGRWIMKDVSVNSNSNSTSNTEGYASYTGVNYRAQTSDSRRIAACDKAVSMATVLWTAPCTFPTWKSSGGVYNTVTATDGSRSTQFVAGKTYQGVPYSMAGRTYDNESWLRLIRSGGMTASSMTGKYYTSKADTTAKGIDCSYLVTYCLGAPDLNTSGMLGSSKFIKISRGQMQPGDVFLKQGHTMLFLGRAENGNYAIVEANASYSRVVYREVSASSLSSYGCYRYKGF